MPSSIDIPQIGAFDLAEAPNGGRQRRSWLVEFLSAPFKDPDGRAAWKQERAERERRLATRRGGRR